MNGAEAHIREAALRHDAIQQAGIIITDLVGLIRSARATPADGVPWRSIDFNESLLDHHHGFGCQQVITIITEHIQRCRGRGKTLRQLPVV